MFLRQLEYLNALAREQHFGRAAAACHVSQPALSTAIRKLEEELGVQLVDRDGRRAELTADGRALIRWVDQTLAGVDGLRSEAAALTAELRGRMRLGVIPTALPAVGELVRPLLDRHGEVEVEVVSMSSREIGEQLASHAIDAGVTYLDNEPLGAVRATPLYQEEYVFVTPEPAAAEIRWADLDGVEICLLSGDMQNRRILDGLFRDAGARPRVRLETNSISALLSFLRAGRPCVVSKAWLDLYGLPAGMSGVPIGDPAAVHEIGIVVPRAGLVAPPVRALLESLAD
ncbi:MAG TPA: LysR family transcriptional regulator [Solirubrobacterales bacterium]|nr:LysR family transcriptional regulator [Solirubrobacterales bacterium]